jgi:ferredoxin
MADKKSKTNGNADGKYYVDVGCIACGVCVGEAPLNFSLDDSVSYAFVKKQPENDNEKNASEDALNACPVEAIGNDG